MAKVWRLTVVMYLNPELADADDEDEMDHADVECQAEDDLQQLRDQVYEGYGRTKVVKTYIVQSVKAERVTVKPRRAR